MTIEQLQEKWYQNYNVDSNTEFDVNIKLNIMKKDDKTIAYIGTDDAYIAKQSVTNTADIAEFVKYYLEHEF